MPRLSIETLRLAAADAIRKLDPRVQYRNPVMAVTCVGALLTTTLTARDLIWPGSAPPGSPGAWFGALISVWLWATVLFANLAEAVAEGQGRAQAATLRKARAEAQARRITGDGMDGGEERVPASQLRKGDRVRCGPGDAIPADGEVIAGAASVDESAVTGESAPVIRESGGDRSAVTGGTRVLSDEIVIRICADPGAGFLDRMIALVEGASRSKTPNEIALHILLVGMTLIFLAAVATLPPIASYAGAPVPVVTAVALLVCLIPTTIGGLLSAIGIAGMDRLVARNVIATSGRAVEAAGDVDVLLMDKTGTITLGNRQATQLLPAPGVPPEELADVARRCSLADETPEGRSIVALADGQLPKTDWSNKLPAVAGSALRASLAPTDIPFGE